MYNRVISKFPNNEESETLAGRITGMLIDLEVLELSEILDIIEDEETLNERVKEALEVLRDEDDNNM